MSPPTRRKIFDVVGEDSPSLCGKDRQEVLHDVEPGDEVELRRQPENAHDQNAILVLVDGLDIGFLPRSDAAELAPALDEGLEYQAIIHEIRGGVVGASKYGARIAIAWSGQKLPSPKSRDDEQRDYWKRKEKQFHGNKGGCLGMLGLIVFVSAVSQMT